MSSRKQLLGSNFVNYAVRRIIMAFLTFYICIYVVAIIGNAQFEATIQSDITEMVNGAVMGNSELKSAEAIADYKRDLRAQLEKRFHLDKPAFVRIGSRALQIISLNLGDSQRITTLYPKRSSHIKDIVLDALKPTLILFLSSTLIAAGLGLVLGIQMARKPGGWLDRTNSLLTMLFVGTPVWWVASLLMLLLVYIIPVFRVGALYSSPAPESAILLFFDYVYYLLLPILSIALVKTWFFAFNTRNIILAPLQEDYIIAARGRGIPERKVLYGHAFATAAPGLVTVTSLGIVQSLAGDILVERVLSRPGLGYTLWQALQFNDINLITAIFAMIAGIYCFTLCLLDLSYFFMDPRIRY
ncbi:MAG: ABC transporter permease [Spirochaetes bacterium]|nr:ABC transporter permease [Spirochaetota bacterium]MBU0954939.1 ABC transporter permease [Spirochaetota bacterium]